MSELRTAVNRAPGWGSRRVLTTKFGGTNPGG